MMTIKVQPKEGFSEKHSSSSKLTKLVQLLSRIYIIPIEYKNEFKETKFTLISWRTFFSFVLVSTPFLLTLIWRFVFEMEFTSLYIEKSIQVYHLFDFVQMFFLHMLMINPFINYPLFVWVIYLWVSFPELSQVYKTIIICSSVSMLIRELACQRECQPSHTVKATQYFVLLRKYNLSE